MARRSVGLAVRHRVQASPAVQAFLDVAELLVPGLSRGVGGTIARFFRCGADGGRLVYLPRKVNDECFQELRGIYDRRDFQVAQQDLSARIGKWQTTNQKLVDWVDANIIETLIGSRSWRCL